MTKPDYLEEKPVGTCKKCGINLWAAHANGPAPHTMPCNVGGCPNMNKHSALMIPFDRSLTGSAMADLG